MTDSILKTRIIIGNLQQILEIIQLRSPRQKTYSTGRLLLQKVVLVGCILSIGSFNFLFAQTPVEANGKLKLVGRQLSSACGNPVQLRGLTTHGLQWYSGCITPSSALKSIKNDWGADIVRLAMYTDPSVNGYLSDTAYWNAQLNQLIDSIGAHGLYCLIDWHILS
ncbi:MAG: glycoside hydrolase family 5 protein, partial [Cytophagales bacterium]|nr:glycoside hydrolase family 5 protein [Cytophagales bacterium]